MTKAAPSAPHRVIVSGASTFLGHHLALHFSRRGWAVVATGRRPSPEQYEGIRRLRARRLEGHAQWRQLDMTDERGMRTLLRDVKPDLFVRCAGVSHNYFSHDYDARAADQLNLGSSQYLFEELGRQRARGIVVTGSSFEYSEGNNPCRESDPCDPTSPYGRANLNATSATCALSERFRVPARVVRMFVPFGSLDAPEKLVPTITESLKAGRVVELSRGDQERDFVYIDDVASLYELMAHDLSRGGCDIVNGATGRATSVRHFAEMAVDRLGAPRSLLAFGTRPLRTFDPPRSIGASDKARGLGFRPRSLEAGIDDYLRSIS